jgi:hypothetical protein
VTVETSYPAAGDGRRAAGDRLAGSSPESRGDAGGGRPADELALRSVRSDRLELPERALFWRWVWSAVRPVVGWVLAGLGALALFLGWYGVSGQALTAKQIPYLVSGGLTGIGLIILAGVFLATEDVRRQLARLDEVERQVSTLYALLVEEVAAPRDLVVEHAPSALAPRPRTEAAPARDSADGDDSANAADGDGEQGELVALPTGASYHRSECGLVAGKPTAEPVTLDEAAERGLQPCRVCDPQR